MPGTWQVLHQRPGIELEDSEIRKEETREVNPAASGPGQEGDPPQAGPPQEGGFGPLLLYLSVLMPLSIT